MRRRWRPCATAIGRGDVYQVNLVQHLSAPFSGDHGGLASAARAAFGPRTMAGDGWAIVSASPELFLARRGRRVWTCPIKGTRPLGEHVEGEKDSAEHVMIVDLERNDLSRVCEPGSVRWPELMAERELAGVTHLVSTVEGTLRSGHRPRRAPRSHVPRRLRDRRAEDRRPRPDRRARAGRPRRLDGRARDVSAATATSSSRSRSAPSRSPRSGSTSGSAAASSGTPSPRPRSRSRGRRRGRCSPRSAHRSRREHGDAARGGGQRARRRRSGRAGAPRGRRGAPAGPGGVRDDPGLRRSAVQAAPSTSTGSRRRPSASGCPP